MAQLLNVTPKYLDNGFTVYTTDQPTNQSSLNHPVSPNPNTLPASV